MSKKRNLLIAAMVASAVFAVRASAGTIIDSQTYENLSTSTNGAAINNTGTISEIINSTFLNNATTASGGAIYNSSDLRVLNSNFYENSAGSAGGAIYNAGSLTIGDGVVFDSNSAPLIGGAIANYGSNIQIGDNVTFSNNTSLANEYISSPANSMGGAIYSEGTSDVQRTITIGDNVSFDSNSAYGGGALYLFGNNDVAIGDNATFSNNYTQYSQSDDSVGGGGGAITLVSNGSNGSASLTIGDNATFDNNTGYFGGAITLGSSDSVLTIGRNATFTNNTADGNVGGAISNVGIVTLGDGAVFSGNSATLGGGAIFNGGTINEFSGTFTENTTEGSGGAIYNYGTMALINSDLSNNYAGVSVGDDSSLTTVSGGQGGAIYNYANLTVSDSVISNNFASSSGGAIYNYSTGSATISNTIFNYNESSSYGGAIDNRGTLTASGTLNFVGNSSGSYGGAILNTNSIDFSNAIVNFTGNSADSSGGAIYNNGIINIDGDVTFVGNTATTYGGAIHNEGTITASGILTFDGNSSGSYGGAILNTNSVDFSEATVSFINNSGVGGGAIYNQSTMTIGDSAYFDNNSDTSIYGGGAIFNNTGGNLTIGEDSVFTNNTSTGYAGGAIYNTATLTIGDGAVFTNNSASSGYGGAIFSSTDLTLNNAIFTNNTAKIGGALSDVYNNDNVITISNSIFDSNTAVTIEDEGGSGGAIALFRYGDITDSTFTNNLAIGGSSNGGAIYMGGNANLSLDNVTFTGNYSNAIGGAIGQTTAGVDYTNDVDMDIANSTFTSNIAAERGGAIFNRFDSDADTAGTYTITGTNFTGNIAGYVLDTDNGTYSANSDGLGEGGAIYNIGDLIISDSTFNSNIALSDGGAIYNSAAATLYDQAFTEGSIIISDSSFIGNTAGTSGGAIYNSGSLTITDTSFTNNSAGENGGAIYNSGTLTITADASDVIFEGNTANGESNAIHNTGTLTLNADNSEIYIYDKITGDDGEIEINDGTSGIVELYETITGNNSVSLLGGTLVLASTANFDSNTALSLASSSALYTIDNVITDYVTGDFSADEGSTISLDIDLASGTSDNFTTTSTTGSVAIEDINITNFGTDFNSIEVFTATDNNSIEITGSYLYYTEDGKTTLTGASSGIINLYYDTTKSTLSQAIDENTGYATFIMNEDQTTDITTDKVSGNFTINNKSTTSNANIGGTGLTIADGANLTIQNTNISSGANIKFEDDASTATLTLSSTNGQDVNIDGDITSANVGNKLTFSSGGNYYVNGTIDPLTAVIEGNVTHTIDSIAEEISYEISSGATLTFMNDTTLYDSSTYTSIANATQTYNLNSITFNGGTLNLANGVTSDLLLSDITVNANSNLYVDVNIANETMDTINADNSVTVNSGNLSIAGLNIMGNSSSKDFAIKFTDSTTLSDAILYSGPAAYTSSIYKYNIAYDTTSDSLLFSMLGNGGYNSYNPSIMSSSVAAQLGGYLTQLNAYNQAFGNMDMYMMMTKEQRQAMKFRNQYAAADGDLVFDPTISQYENKSGWARPYATFESVSLNNGPKVSNVAYGTFLGADSELYDLGNGWDAMYNVYVAYNGSHQSYDGVSIYQNGGTLGASGMLYKGNFFTGLTANTGANAGEASSDFGRDSFAMLMAGVASKSGYNFEMADGKFIIQPSYMMSYTFVNTFDYTTASGVSMKSDPLNAISIEPGIKFIGNLENGWQPYASVSMVWNIMDKTDFMANDVSLPGLSVDPYVRYGVGVRKSWGERFTGFFQTYLTSGGRNGVGLQAGFRLMFGDKSSKQEKAENKIQPAAKTKISLEGSK